MPHAMCGARGVLPMVHGARPEHVDGSAREDLVSIIMRVPSRDAAGHHAFECGAGRRRRQGSSRSSLRSDPADAGPADLDRAYAQLRFGNYVMAPLCATLPCRWLSLTTVSSGAILRSSRRCHTTPPPHRTDCMRSAFRSPLQSSDRTFLTQRCCSMFDRWPDIQPAHSRAERRAVSVTRAAIARSFRRPRNVPRTRSSSPANGGRRP
jgi:hypothetical protein